MEAKLNIYADCTSEEPTKTYVCRRMLLKVAKKVASMTSNMDKKSEDEQEQITLDVLKTIFPDFKDEDLEGIDPAEYMRFVEAIGFETNQILQIAQKN